MKSKAPLIKLLLILMISAIVTVFLYILLHEFGHVIVMLSAGDRITECEEGKLTIVPTQPDEEPSLDED